MRFYLKDQYDFDELLKYGFKESHYDNTYEYINDQYTIFIYKKDFDVFKKRILYIELSTLSVISDFGKLIELYNNGLLESVI